MSDNKWFTNHGQRIATVGTIGSLIVALLTNWDKISQHDGLVAWWPVVAVPVSIYAAFRVGRSSRENKPTTVPAEPPKESKIEPEPAPKPFVLPKYSDRFELDQDSISFEAKTVKLGDFWEVGSDLDRLKIAPVAIKPLERDEQGVEIRFHTQGSMFYGGSETKETGTNKFVLGVTRSGFQAEPLCAYQYSFSEKHVHFKAVRVDHINAVNNEVVLEICMVALRKLHREIK